MLYAVFFWHSLNSSAILVHFEIKDLILSILFLLSTLQEGRPYMEPEMHMRLLLMKLFVQWRHFQQYIQQGQKSMP